MHRTLHELEREAFETCLRHVFTNWQVQIIDKKLKRLPLTEAERVEFSRNIKKKLVAIDVLQDLRLLLY